jgi:outer membrane lipoprotein-sorting protein
MKRRRTSRRPVATLLCAFLAVAPAAVGGGTALAQDPPQQAAVERPERAELTSLEHYLNSVRTVRSAFVQTASNGRMAEGMLYLARPGRLRIDYKPPVQLQIFGDSFWLIFVDAELKEVNQLPIDATPAAILLQDKINFSGDIKVQRVSRENGLVKLHVVQTKDPDAGRLIVSIATNPLALRGWTVIDAQGVATTVTLVAPVVNEKIADRVFLYSPPDWANTEIE